MPKFSHFLILRHRVWCSLYRSALLAYLFDFIPKQISGCHCVRRAPLRFFSRIFKVVPLLRVDLIFTHCLEKLWSILFILALSFLIFSANVKTLLCERLFAGTLHFIHCPSQFAALWRVLE